MEHTRKHERLVYNIHDLGEHNGLCFGEFAYRKLVGEVSAASLRSVEVALDGEADAAAHNAIAVTTANTKDIKESVMDKGCDRGQV